MLGVFQLAYLSLANNNFIPLYLSSLIPWFYYANGYNIKPTHFPDPSLFPKSVIAISYTNKFVYNFNISAIILFLSVMFTCVYNKLVRPCLSQTSLATKISDKINEFMIEFVLISALNAGFSAGLQFRYGTYETPLDKFGLFVSIAVLVLYVCCILWLFKFHISRDKVS